MGQIMLSKMSNNYILIKDKIMRELHKDEDLESEGEEGYGDSPLLIHKS